MGNDSVYCPRIIRRCLRRYLNYRIPCLHWRERQNLLTLAKARSAHTRYQGRRVVELHNQAHSSVDTLYPGRRNQKREMI